MDKEKLYRRLDVISDKIKEFGFDIKEDLYELISQQPEIGEKILNFKLKKVAYFNDDENNSYVGFTLEDTQVTFYVELGEDEDGPWYEITAEIINF
ncbi:hypothetical protein [Ilyobacter polytropus]|uniref:Uncharacterized protein n=1 Tax=Ilyobacter polytropus (strain ATCC 51220 / DSM 2926 / LMG 16218 / CuHBu1) TaxID=572544 RepID=E3HDF6_ILYPC|nr:hypothetical protein [Ilyobacter polytropus]ADO84559.1 hypothetical protein Ilyop_2805 [Ilyobacter polytropus DSM 2926]